MYHARETEFMKQRKPYGRPFDPKIDGPNSGAQSEKKPNAPPSVVATAQYKKVDEDAAKNAYVPVHGRQKKSFGKAGKVLLTLALLVGLTTFYIAARDDANVQLQLKWYLMNASAMSCTHGVMLYHNGSLPDRLLGNGSFQCTEWKMKGG